MSTSTTPTRVKGTLVDDKVTCSCGRCVGLVNEAGAEFFCRHCHINVVLDIRESKMEKFAAILTHNARLAEQNLEIARMIAAL